MELAWSLFLWPTICLAAALALIHRLPLRRNARKLPPGPPRWPVVGNMFDLGVAPHRALAALAEEYGPVMLLRLGAINSVVIQSTKAAKEMFKNHDLVYSGRTITEAMRACQYNQGSLALAQYGPYWRTMKRLFITEMMTSKRIKETEHLRRKNIDKMIQWIDEKAQDDGGVDVAHFVFLMTFNLVGNLLLSHDLLDPQSTKGPEFFKAMDGLMKSGGLPNVADFFPFLKWLDPQRIRKNMERDMRKVMEIVSGFIKERINDQQAGEQMSRKDFLGVLLEYEGEGDEPANLSESELVILILEIFFGGTETTSSTIGWAMTELLRDSKRMSKVREELADVVGCNRRMEETDIEKLYYLQAIVKETLRLHPPVPFLIPRRAVRDNDFMGYHIPEDTQVLVNAWAIGRDSEAWDDPLSFKPERFLSSDIDYQGQDFEFIPFGSGRRMCPGIPLGHCMLHLALGSLLHCFDWELHHSVSQCTTYMRERMGITLRKDIPLKVIPKKMKSVY